MLQDVHEQCSYVFSYMYELLLKLGGQNKFMYFVDAVHVHVHTNKSKILGLSEACTYIYVQSKMH